jgi:hypothetical protein
MLREVCIRKEMPRQKCTQCGVPLESLSFYSKCEFCGTRANARFSARNAWEMIGPFAVFVAWLAVATHGHIFSAPYLTGLELLLGALSIGFAIFLRGMRSRNRSTLLVDILKPASETKSFPIRDFPHEAVFAAPRSWKSILDSPRPRAVRLSTQAKLAMVMVPAIFALFVVAGVTSRGQHILAIGDLFFAFVFAWLFYGVADAIRGESAARRLLQHGEVTTGWITDCWETNGKTKKIHITVEFRDTVGRLFVRDFVVQSTEDSVDPGHPILVFFEALNPEKNTVACSTMFRLADG